MGIIKKIFSLFFKKNKKNNNSGKLEKSLANPIIAPKTNRSWEAWQTFNPATIYLNKKVHFLYRAIGQNGFSVLGYALSKNGINIEERSLKPAYLLEKEKISRLKDNRSIKINYSSGGSFAGCEDPRIVEIDGLIYLIHTTFSDWSYLRMTFSCIRKKDFLKKRWKKWSDPVFISPPGEVHKNWVLFPKKIRGKFAILHSISPRILIDYFESLDFDGKSFIKSNYSPCPIQGGWEAYCRGAGPPPIKTKEGWLLLYHAVDKKDSSKYKLGAMILDYSNPEKILYRAKEPVLEPNLDYENNGFKPGVVYSCGAVVIKKRLFVYYGGADSVTCVASAPLEKFLKSFIKTKKPKLKKVSWLKKILNKYGFNKKI